MLKVSLPSWGHEKIGDNHNRGKNVLFCQFVWGFSLFLLTCKHDLALILCLGAYLVWCLVFCLLCHLISAHEAREQKSFVFLPVPLSPLFIATTASLLSWSLYTAWAQESFEQSECFYVQTARSPGIIYKDCIRSKIREFGGLPWVVLMVVHGPDPHWGRHRPFPLHYSTTAGIEEQWIWVDVGSL